jgi:hypothetical protein
MIKSVPPSIKSVPPTSSVKAKVAVFVSLASLAYASSLALQRIVPALRDALAWPLPGGIAPTYFLRIALSAALGLSAALFVSRRPVSEARLAWITAVAVGASVVSICVFP